MYNDRQRRKQTVLWRIHNELEKKDKTSTNTAGWKYFSKCYLLCPIIPYDVFMFKLTKKSDFLNRLRGTRRSEVLEHTKK